jgi:hypothetical protein
MLVSPFKIVDGPSLTVDHILRLTKQPNITSFVEENKISAVLETNQDPNEKALYVKCSEDAMKTLDILKCARVGITMKKYEKDRELFFGRHYRYLSRPGKISKGKHCIMCCFLHQYYV